MAPFAGRTGALSGDTEERQLGLVEALRSIREGGLNRAAGLDV